MPPHHIAPLSTLQGYCMGMPGCQHNKPKPLTSCKTPSAFLHPILANASHAVLRVTGTLAIALPAKTSGRAKVWCRKGVALAIGPESKRISAPASQWKISRGGKIEAPQMKIIFDIIMCRRQTCNKHYEYVDCMRHVHLHIWENAFLGQMTRYSPMEKTRASSPSGFRPRSIINNYNGRPTCIRMLTCTAHEWIWRMDDSNRDIWESKQNERTHCRD